MMENIDFKPMTYKEAEALACSESVRLECDIYIYRLRNGRFRVTSNKKTIPIEASIHNTIGAS
jgi:hypothetical protein